MFSFRFYGTVGVLLCSFAFVPEATHIDQGFVQLPATGQLEDEVDPLVVEEKC